MQSEVSDLAIASLLSFCKVSPALSASVWETGMRNGGACMFTSQPSGFVSSPYTDTNEITKGLGATREPDGVHPILADFDPGLTDIEGFSHLFVLWEFDRSQ